VGCPGIPHHLMISPNDPGVPLGQSIAARCTVLLVFDVVSGMYTEMFKVFDP